MYQFPLGNVVLAGDLNMKIDQLKEKSTDWYGVDTILRLQKTTFTKTVQPTHSYHLSER